MRLLGPRYVMPLNDWIMLALNRTTLDEVVRGIRTRAKPEKLPRPSTHNKRYINKILSEEVTKQFNHVHRPLVEVISNAIDAKPEGATDYSVDVCIQFGGHFVCQDTGKSMTLEQLLTMLIIPFATDKDPTKDIGRFGVGFLSALNYCLRNPKDSAVKITTHTGAESYKAEFFSTGPSVDELVLAVSPVSLPIWKRHRTGTTVRIEACVSQKKTTIQYLAEQFGSFTARRAQIGMNGKLLNPEFDGSAYYFPQAFTVRGQQVQQDVGVIISHPNGSGNGSLLLTSQGIQIERKVLAGANIKVDFPPAVLVVEGRDEFRIDGNYQAALEKVFELLSVHIMQNQNNPEVMKRMPDTVASMAGSLGINNPRDLPYYAQIFKGLFREARYIIPGEEYQELRRFFGKEADKHFYVASEVGSPFWSTCFLPHSEFIGTHLIEKQTYSSGEVFASGVWLGAKAENPPPEAGEAEGQTESTHPSRIPNLDYLLKEIAPRNGSELHHTSAVSSVRVVTNDPSLNEGTSPFMLDEAGGMLLINASHPLLQAPNILHAYLVAKRFSELFLPPEKAEKELWGGSHARYYK